jgi:hypothetical protein
MKILSRSNQGLGNMLKIEDKESKKGYTWFFMTEAVVAFVDKVGIKAEDDIEFTAEEVKGEETITRITKYPLQKDNSNISVTGKIENDPRQLVIIKQSSMKTAGDAVATAMAGQIADVNVLGDNIIILYKKLLAEILK